MKFIPRPYQSPAMDFIIATPRCNLWADMGLGKSAIVLSALDALAMVEDPFPALVVGPLRVARRVWHTEAARWDHTSALRVSRIIGSENERRRAVKEPAEIYTVNYEQLPWLVNWYANGKAWPFRTVVADECSKLKGFRLRQSTLRAGMLAKVAHHAAVKRWMNLTGTPAPNGLEDLWGQQWFVDAGKRLGLSYSAYMQRWFTKSFDGYSVKPLPHAHEEIHAKLADCTMSIKAADWFKLDEPIVNDIVVELPKTAKKLYRDMERKMFMELNGVAFEAFNAGARTMKCLQLASGAIYTNEADGSWEVAHDEKLDALESVLNEASGPVLVAYHFQSDLARLKKRFKQGIELKSDQSIDQWAKGKVELAFAHPASMGHGIDGLQHGGNTLVFFSHDWNLENYLQMIERIGPVRQMQSGYKRPVYIHHIYAQDTVDELVKLRRETKREVQDLLREAMGARQVLAAA